MELCIPYTWVAWPSNSIARHAANYVHPKPWKENGCKAAQFVLQAVRYRKTTEAYFDATCHLEPLIISSLQVFLLNNVKHGPVFATWPWQVWEHMQTGLCHFRSSYPRWCWFLQLPFSSPAPQLSSCSKNTEFTLFCVKDLKVICFLYCKLSWFGSPS